MQDRKTIRTNRMKAYFIDAAKAIIADQGVEKLSVRNVADQAGFSYATLYNYYKDLDGLLWEVKKSFTEDLMQSLEKAGKEAENWDTRKGLEAYADFFLEQPALFRFFFQWPLSANHDGAKETLALFGQISQMSANGAGQNSHENGTETFKAGLYIVHGLLLLFYSGNGMGKDAFREELGTALALIFTP